MKVKSGTKNPFDYNKPDAWEVKSQWVETRGGKLRWMVYLNNGIQMFRSRYIMAKYLCLKNLYLPAKIIIHHIDENTENDNIDNLTLMTRSQHKNHHNPPFITDIKEYKRKWAYSYRQCHKEETLKKAKDYYWKHRSQIREGRKNYEKLYYQQNKEKIKARVQKYRIAKRKEVI